MYLLHDLTICLLACTLATIVGLASAIGKSAIVLTCLGLGSDNQLHSHASGMQQ
jgi:hypothetical protein